MGTGWDGMRFMATDRMDVDHGRAGFTRGPPISPLCESKQNVAQIASLLGQPILKALGPLLIALALDHTMVDQCLQTHRKDVPCDSQVLLQRVEMRDTCKEI